MCVCARACVCVGDCYCFWGERCLNVFFFLFFFGGGGLLAKNYLYKKNSVLIKYSVIIK